MWLLQLSGKLLETCKERTVRIAPGKFLQKTPLLECKGICSPTNSPTHSLKTFSSNSDAWQDAKERATIMVSDSFDLTIKCCTFSTSSNAENLTLSFHSWL